MRPRGRARKLANSAVTLVAFTLPVYLFVGLSSSPTFGREPVPGVTLTSVQIARARSFPEFTGAVPILTYHDVSANRTPLTVTPHRFAEQMAMLKAAGFHPIDVAQFMAYLERGAPLPSRPILITFDDGLHSAWSAADPILASYGFRAVAFVIAGQLGQHRPYYMSAGELRDLASSGRWDIEAHTWLGHGDVVVDDQGAVGPFLTNRAWLAEKNRLETRDEFARRIDRDLDRDIASFRSAGLPAPALFAYPFSTHEATTDDPALLGILRRSVASRFPVSLVDDAGQRFVNRSDMHGAELPRILVTSRTTGDRLLERLRAATPLPPRLRGLSPDRWISERGRPLPARLFTRDRLTLRSRTSSWSAAYWSPAQTGAWRDYSVSLGVTGLGAADSGANGTVLLRASDQPRASRLAVTLAAGRVTVQRLRAQGTATVASTVIPERPSHRLDLSLAGDRLTVAVDGDPVLRPDVPWSSRGGIGLGAWRSRAGSPHPQFSHLVVAPP